MPSLVDELKSWYSTLLARLAALLSVRPLSHSKLSFLSSDHADSVAAYANNKGKSVSTIRNTLDAAGSIAWHFTAHRYSRSRSRRLRAVCSAAQARQEHRSPLTSEGTSNNPSKRSCASSLGRAAAQSSQHIPTGLTGPPDVSPFQL